MIGEPDTDNERRVRGFMCMIDWYHELVAADRGNKVYPSEAALREHHRPAEHCGIVEVEIRLVRVVHPGDGT